jgi:hypothetical protein
MMLKTTTSLAFAAACLTGDRDHASPCPDGRRLRLQTGLQWPQSYQGSTSPNPMIDHDKNVGTCVPI